MRYIQRIAVVMILLGLPAPGRSHAGQPQDPAKPEAAAKTFIISGNVGLPGVVMKGLPGNPVTDSAGVYRAEVPYGWSGRVTPAGEGCQFMPPSRVYQNVTADRTDPYVVTGLAVPRPSDLGAGILVIPTAPVEAGKLAETSEDLRVMLQILREKLSEPRLIRGGLIDYGDFFGDTDRAGEVVYLQGHAVMFVLRVDFPLVPTAAPPASEGEPDKGAGDPVWQKARQKIQNPAAGQTPGVTLARIKETLLQSLKHAANVRNIGLDEWLMVTVISRGEPSGAPAPASAGGSYAHRGGVWFEGRSYSTSSATFGPSGGSTQADSKTYSRGSNGGPGRVNRTRPGSTPAAPTTVLTIQAKKGDVDAFAKGTLNFEQFQQQAKIFTY